MKTRQETDVDIKCIREDNRTRWERARQKRHLTVNSNATKNLTGVLSLSFPMDIDLME